jgi:hypothetical protein
MAAGGRALDGSAPSGTRGCADVGAQLADTHGGDPLRRVGRLRDECNIRVVRPDTLHARLPETREIRPVAPRRAESPEAVRSCGVRRYSFSPVVGRHLALAACHAGGRRRSSRLPGAGGAPIRAAAFIHRRGLGFIVESERASSIIAPASTGERVGSTRSTHRSAACRDTTGMTLGVAIGRYLASSTRTIARRHHSVIQ